MKKKITGSIMFALGITLATNSFNITNTNTQKIVKATDEKEVNVNKNTFSKLIVNVDGEKYKVIEDENIYKEIQNKLANGTVYVELDNNLYFSLGFSENTFSGKTESKLELTKDFNKVYDSIMKDNNSYDYFKNLIKTDEDKKMFLDSNKEYMKLGIAFFVLDLHKTTTPSFYMDLGDKELKKITLSKEDDLNSFLVTKTGENKEAIIDSLILPKDDKGKVSKIVFHYTTKEDEIKKIKENKLSFYNYLKHEIDMIDKEELKKELNKEAEKEINKETEKKVEDKSTKKPLPKTSAVK